MSNNQRNDINKKQYKSALANYCLEKGIKPYYLNGKVNNVYVKNEDATYTPVNQANDITGKELYVVYRTNDDKNKLLKFDNVLDVHFDELDKSLNLIWFDKDRLNMISTTDFRREYALLTVGENHDLSERLDALEEAAKKVGKDVVFISSTIIVDTKRDIELDSFDELTKGDEIELYDGMFHRDGSDAPDEAYTHVHDVIRDSVQSTDITIVDGDDTIYVEVVMFRELCLEMEHDGGGMMPPGEAVILLQEIENNPEQEPELMPGFEPGEIDLEQELGPSPEM